MSKEVGNQEVQEKPAARVRSVSFPLLSLPQAVKIIKDAGAYGPRHSRTAIATYGGHSSANSGPFKQKLSALRDWGFISGNGDELELTELAMKIAYPLTPQDGVESLQRAFMGCSIFQELYDTSAKGKPLTLDSISNQALHNLHVSAGAKTSFVRSFVDSAEVVGLLTRLDAERVELKAHSTNVTASGPVPSISEATPASQTSISDRPERASSKPTIDQNWIISGGNISFTVTTVQPLASSSFAQLGTIMTAIETLAESLKEEDSDE
jgi:hypothetical protein